MSPGPRFARRVDTNHAEIRDLFRECGCSVQDTSNMGGKVGDLIVQYRDPSTRRHQLTTWIIETKSTKKKKLTDSQKNNPIELVRIDCRADVFDLLGQVDPELDCACRRAGL